VKLLLAIFALIALCGCRTPDRPVINGVPSLAPVVMNKGIWRGGQFNSEGVEWLKYSQINRRLKLNTNKEGRDGFVKADNMTVRYSPITIWQQFGLVAIPPQQIEDDITFMAAGQCFVGCEHGEDRTGLVVACYRVRFQGWPKKLAWKEAKLRGYHRWMIGLNAFWWNFKP
jgi:hypothetical protein